MAPSLPLLLPGLDEYLASLVPPRPAPLARMEEEAELRRIPIVGPAVGKLLAQLARLAGARRVFELGSAIGYSTAWFAQAVGDGGEVFWTDSSEANGVEARAGLEALGLSARVRFLVGDALASLERTEGPFDVVFVDHDKEGYPAAFRAAVPRLRAGGLLLADNVLWGGRLRLPAVEDDPATRAIRDFTRLAVESPDLETTVLPIRDGLLVARKI